MSVYQFSATTINGDVQSLSDYEGKVLLIVNTASKCGFTPQYQELQQLYDTYREQGFVILGFPCNQFREQEPGTENEIKAFCQTNYGVTFPLFSKIDVKGPHIHPLYEYLTAKKPGILSKDIKWNFTKFLVNKQGEVVRRYAPTTKPLQISKDIERELAK
jgi:glutathione peroxidase